MRKCNSGCLSAKYEQLENMTLGAYQTREINEKMQQWVLIRQR